MGRASRWFRGLFGMKKERENVENFNNSNYWDKKEKKRWSFARTGKDIGQVPASLPAGGDTAWLRSYMTETEKEQSKHAIAVAAATAAAADAAVAAAQAAVAVVRLTNHGRVAMFSGGKEKLAAIRIQTVFRGYLARKALRALKGLVKLQGLVRGYLVRKRAAATLHSMQALIRAQASVTSQRARRSMTNDSRCQPEIRTRKSIERFEETRSEFHSKRLSTSYDPSLNGFDESPKIVEIDSTHKTRSSMSMRMSTCMTDYGDEQQQQHYPVNSSSPLPCPVPARLSIPDRRPPLDSDCKCATANTTPRFAAFGLPNCIATPEKSVCGEDSFFFRPYSYHPSYMGNTQSFRAKSRSQSAPRRRPEEEGLKKKKRIPLNEIIMASRSSFTGVRMQRTCSHVQEDQACS